MYEQQVVQPTYVTSHNLCRGVEIASMLVTAFACAGFVRPCVLQENCRSVAFVPLLLKPGHLPAKAKGKAIQSLAMTTSAVTHKDSPASSRSIPVIY